MIPETAADFLRENGVDPNDLQFVTVTMSDVRHAGYCGPGLRNWMTEYGFDLRDFVKSGMPALTMATTNDAHGLNTVLVAMKRYYDGR